MQHIAENATYGAVWLPQGSIGADIGHLGGAFGCLWAAFGGTGVANDVYGRICCIWLLGGWPQGPQELREHALEVVK